MLYKGFGMGLRGGIPEKTGRKWKEKEKNQKTQGKT
jgi:hypothetical protein